jgi:hypothetical protein
MDRVQRSRPGMLIEVDLRRRRRMCHSPYKRSSDGLLNGKDPEMAKLVIKQQNCRKQVVISAVGTVGGPGPRASIMTNAGNEGSAWQGTRQGRLLMQ